MKTKHYFRLFPIMVMGCFLVLMGSCSKEEATPEISISDNNFYMMVGTSLINCYMDIYNQNLAGKPTGYHDFTTDGPMGGTVTITGNTTYDNTHGITTTDLLLDMTSINYTYSYTDSGNKTWLTQITITGSATYLGSFSNSYTSVNHQSDNLEINGTVSWDGITRTINSTGQVSLNRSSNTSCNIFGHVVSW